MTIATKEQERNTLEKIKKIVAELGENSYLTAAFTGAFELAEENIENDWGSTTQEYIDQASKYDAEFKRAETNAKLIVQYDADKRQLTANLEATQERASKYAHEIDDLKAAINAKEAETIRLKAKLYDYMTIPA